MTIGHILARVAAYLGAWGIISLAIAVGMHRNTDTDAQCTASLLAGAFLSGIFLLIVLGITYW